MEDLKFYTLAKTLKEKKPISALKVQALLKNIQEGVQGNGKKYVYGELIDKQFSIKFKKWECSKKEFVEENNIDLNKTYVVNAVGRYEFFLGEPQFIITENLELIEDEKEVEKYLDCIPNDTINNEISIVEGIGDKIKDPVLKEVFNMAMSDTDKILVAPYSDKYHTERGGYFQHLVNCMINAGTKKGLYMKKKGDKTVLPYDPDIINVSLMVYHIAYLDNIKVNNMGNIVERNEVNEVLLGNFYNIIKTYNLFIKASQKINRNSEKQIPVIHCVAALNGLIEPATLEAILVCNTVRAELEEWESAKHLSTVQANEIVTYKENDKAKTLVNLQ